MYLEKPNSPATKLLYDVWESIQPNKPTWSWLRLNSCMQKALELAIKSSMYFNLDDFSYISRNFNWGRWVGDAEWVYRHAITENNKSAVYAFEKSCKRKPFIVNNVYCGNGVSRQRERLAVGFSFNYNNQNVEVTSFNDKTESVIACSYKPYKYDDKGYAIGKHEVEHIYKLTHNDLKG